MHKTAVAIRHVHFEDLGIFDAVLSDAGYAVRYHDLDADPFATLDPLEPDLLIVLGGPVGVYETEAYPYLAEECAILATRLAAARPTLGICLGAQQIAKALGADVGPMGHKEIGFGPLRLNDAGRVGPLRHLEGIPVLHWHGDAFQIPDTAENLASTPLCATQGFSLGHHVLALQFHPEVDVTAGIERWLTGHAAELAGAGIDPRVLRTHAAQVGPELREAGQKMLAEWLQGVV
ncbi:glutamine amidotransferase [Sphingobium amiense]|uniref:Glutamine amidotransferase n=1 Tax=Sphingobium amiense TaxID=135719 RepID=A0A494WBE4_9SPHN|nr:glutamine amidotransferase [Sphingobium amiense]BBE00018.1 glutamine amidotransferase [Sphingobium amiense]